MIEAKAEEYIEDSAGSPVAIDNHFALYGIPCDHHDEREYRIPKHRSHSEEIKTEMDWVTFAFSRAIGDDINEGRDMFAKELYRA